MVTASAKVQGLPDVALSLLAWWDAGHTELPWRGIDDPYRIWVAEVMLQQTRVATVIPYYERWLARFPTVEDLAQASLDEVLKVWEGMGYYGRARNLHAAAQDVVAHHGGELPDDVAGLQKLKGVGRYTAGSIASIAFGRPVPAVDGNVIRVLSRLLDVPDDVTRPATRDSLWRLAAQLVPDERPGVFNQAMMELGQRVCYPAVPECHLCPLARQCLACARGTQLERPVRPPRRRTPHFDVAAAVIWRYDEQFLIAQRPLDGLLGGLWEFPGGKQEAGEELPETLRREIKEELGITIEVGRALTTIKHAYTHFRITLHAYHARHVDGKVQNLGVADHRWVKQDQLDGYAFAVTDQKIIHSLRSEADRGVRGPQLRADRDCHGPKRT